MSTGSEDARGRRKRVPRWVLLLAGLAVVVVGLPLLVTRVVFTGRVQEGPSMEPSLPADSRFFIARFGGAEPGDVVVVRTPEGVDVAKRVIASGGDTVRIVDGHPHVNGEPIVREELGPAEPESTGMTCFGEAFGEVRWLVLEESDGSRYDGGPVVVPEGHVYVLGDNRPRSNDSRHFGTVSQEAVEGALAWIDAPGRSPDRPRCVPAIE